MPGLRVICPARGYLPCPVEGNLQLSTFQPFSPQPSPSKGLSQDVPAKQQKIRVFPRSPVLSLPKDPRPIELT
jgi:hypothetical protein